MSSIKISPAVMLGLVAATSFPEASLANPSAPMVSISLAAEQQILGRAEIVVLARIRGGLGVSSCGRGDPGFYEICTGGSCFSECGPDDFKQILRDALKKLPPIGSSR